MEHLLDFEYVYYMQTPIRPFNPMNVPLIGGEWTGDNIGENTTTRTRWVFPRNAPTEWAVAVAHESLNEQIATVYLLVNDPATKTVGTTHWLP
jgi:hypothetical protein